MKYPSSIYNLIECFKKLPGIGEKTAERLALSILKQDPQVVELFSKSLIDVNTKIKRCNVCNNLTEEDICEICKSKERDNKIVFIVEDPKHIILFEKIGSYKGLYHVLDGLISPLDGIGPEQLKIGMLIDRIEKNKIEEVIIAVKPSIEGETTSLYISRMLKGLPVKVTKLAHGIPLGIDMEYVDIMTLEMALQDRKDVSN